MKVAALAVIGALNGIAASMGTANAMPLAPYVDANQHPASYRSGAAAARVGVRPGTVAYPTPVGEGPALPVGARATGVEANGVGGGRPYETAWLPSWATFRREEWDARKPSARGLLQGLET